MLSSPTCTLLHTTDTSSRNHCIISFTECSIIAGEKPCFIRASCFAFFSRVRPASLHALESGGAQRHLPPTSVYVGQPVADFSCASISCQSCDVNDVALRQQCCLLKARWVRAIGVPYNTGQQLNRLSVTCYWCLYPENEMMSLLDELASGVDNALTSGKRYETFNESCLSAHQ